MKKTALLFLLAGWAAPAHADCGIPPLQALWSFPTNGQTDVPLNSELWVVVPWGHDAAPVR